MAQATLGSNGKVGFPPREVMLSPATVLEGADFDSQSFSQLSEREYGLRRSHKVGSYFPIKW